MIIASLRLVVVSQFVSEGLEYRAHGCDLRHCGE